MRVARASGILCGGLGISENLAAATFRYVPGCAPRLPVLLNEFAGFALWFVVAHPSWPRRARFCHELGPSPTLCRPAHRGVAVLFRT